MSIPSQPLRTAVLAVFLALAGGEAPAEDSPRAGDADALFHRAYFLEIETGKYEEALPLYEKVAELSAAPRELRERAGHRAQGCREALRAADLLALLPSEALVYAEISRPGGHLRRLLENLGFTARATESEDASRSLISPRLLAALDTIDGVAAAVTDFDPERGEPRGVVVLNTGRSDAVHGFLETLLGGALRAKAIRSETPILGHATYEAPLGTISLTRRLVVAGTSRDLVAAVLERLEVKTSPPAAASVAPSGRRGALASVVLNTKPLLARLKKDFLRSERDAEDYRRIQALVDFESVRSIGAWLVSEGTALSLELAFDLDEGNHALAYHLLRSPAAGQDALRAIPSGAAAFLAFGLGEKGSEAKETREAPAGAPAVTGLDIGRELFANIRDVALFVLPPGGPAGARAAEPREREPASTPARRDQGVAKGRSRSAGEGENEDEKDDWRPARQGRGGQRSPGGNLRIPDAALVLTVKDAAKSEALWRQILSVVAVLARPSEEALGTETIGGREVRVLSLPEGFTLRIAALADRVVLASSAVAVERAMGAAGGKGSVLDDAGFVNAAAQLAPESSKLLAAHVGRLVPIALALGMGPGPDDVPPDLLQALGKTVIVLSTHEEPSRFRAKLSMEVPRLAETIDKLLGEAAGNGGF